MEEEIKVRGDSHFSSLQMIGILLTFCIVMLGLAGGSWAMDEGERIYRKACLPCHGARGDGRGPAAAYLNPKPRDFTRGIYKFRSTPSGSLPTDEDLFRTISRGIPRTSMPSWEKILSEEERMDVVQYIKTFSEKFEKRRPRKEIPIPEEIPVTSETISQGERIYRLLKCWSCHGKAGRGDGPSAGNLEDDWGDPIEAYDFTRGDYKSGPTDQDLYRTLNTGLNGTPMPSHLPLFLFTKESYKDLTAYQGYFSGEEIEDLAAYVDAQISREERAALTDEEKVALADKRRWQLVHYVKSLSREKGLFFKLFLEDTETTK